jgi:hypothetical protein
MVTLHLTVGAPEFYPSGPAVGNDSAISQIHVALDRAAQFSHEIRSVSAFRGQNREPFSESWMRETRLSSSMSGLCQEDERSSCCTKDEGGPFGAAL